MLCSPSWWMFWHVFGAITTLLLSVLMFFCMCVKKTIIVLETKTQINASSAVGVLQGDCGQSREGKCTECGDGWEDLPDLCRVSRRCQVYCSSVPPCGCWDEAGHCACSDLLTLLLSVWSSCWFSVLNRVHSASPEQLMEMHHEQANPKNAVVSAGSPLCCLQISFKHWKIQKLKIHYSLLIHSIKNRGCHKGR